MGLNPAVFFNGEDGGNMTEIDSLEMKISAELKQADKAVNRLAANLGNLSRALNFSKKIQGLKNLKESMGSIFGTIIPQTQKLANTIAGIAKAGDGSAAATKELSKAAIALKEATDKIVKAEGIAGSVNSCGQAILRYDYLLAKITDVQRDSTEETGKNSKTKLFTLPFDELNILPDTSDDLFDSMKEIGNIDISMGGIFDDLANVTVETPINNWVSRIRDVFLAQGWEELGKTIAEMANIGLSFTNCLDWDGGINFELFGQKLSVRFREAVDEINWMEIGNAMGNDFMSNWRQTEEFIENMWSIDPETLLSGWEEAGIAIGETVYGIFERIDFGGIGTTLAGGFHGIFEVIRSFNEKMADDSTWQMIEDNISEGLNNAISGIHPVEAVQALGRFVTDLLGTMLRVAETTPWSELGTKVGQFLANIPWTTIIGQVFGIISNVFGGFFGGFSIEIFSHFGEIGTALANGFNAAFKRLRNFADEVTWGVIADDIYTGLNNMIHGIQWAEAGKALGDFAMKLLGVFQKVAEETDWKGFGERIGQFLSNINWQEILGQVFDIIKNTLWGLIDGLNETAAGKIILGVGVMVAGFEGLSKILPIINALFGDNGKIITVFKSIFGEEGKIASIVMSLFGTKGKLVTVIVAGIAASAAILAVGGKDLVDACFGFMSGLLDSLIEAVRKIDWANVWHNIVAGLGAIFSNSTEIIGKVTALAIELISYLIAGFIEYTLSPEFLKDLAEIGLNLILGLVKGVMAVIDVCIDIVKAIYHAIVDGIKSWFDINSPSRVMEELGIFIMQGLVNGISSLIDFAVGIFTGLVELIKGIWTGLSEFLGGLWEGIRLVAEIIWGGIGEFFGGFWEGIQLTAETAWNGIFEFLQETWGFIFEAATIIWSGVLEFFSGIWNGIQEAVTIAWNEISELLGNIWNFIFETATIVWSAISEFFSGIWNGIRETVETVWNGISEFLGGIWNFIKDNAETIMNGVSNFFRSVWDGIKSTAEEIWVNISNFLKEEWEGIQKTAQDIWNVVSEFFQGVWEGIKKTAEDIWNGIAGFLEDSWNGIKDTAERVWEFISISLQNIWNGIKETAGEIWDGVKTVFSEAWNSIKSTAEEKWENIKNSLWNIWDGIKNTAKGAADGIAGFFSNAWDGITTKTKETYDKVKETIGEFANNAYDKVKDVPDKVYSAVKDTGEKMKTTGENIIDGLVGGIKNTAHKVYDTMSKVAGNVVGFTNQLLGIHSPSKVFEEIGDFTMQGFANGVDAEKRTLLEKMSQMAENVIKPFARIESIFGGIGEGGADSFLGGMESFINCMRDIGKNAAEAFSDSFNKNAELMLWGYGNCSMPEWNLETVAQNRMTAGQNDFSRRTGGEYVSINNQSIFDGIEEAAYKGFVRANAENTREESLLEELIQAVKEGKSITIDGREIVTTYDKWKNRMGWAF